jgi:hypothetical protein
MRRRRSGHEIHQKYLRKYPHLKKNLPKRPSVGDIYTDGTYSIQIINTDNPMVIGKYLDVFDSDNTNLTKNNIEGHQVYFFPNSETKYRPYCGNQQCGNSGDKIVEKYSSFDCPSRKNHRENPQG